MDVLEKVKELISKQLNIKPEIITDDKEIVKDLGADSLDVVEMLMSLEDDFGITIPDEETADIKTVKDITELIKKHM